MKRGIDFSAAGQRWLLAQSQARRRRSNRLRITADCPSGDTCVESRCIADNGNSPPTVAIGTIAPSVGQIIIPVTVFDASSHEITLSAELDQGGTFVPITATAQVAATPNGTPAQLTWDAAAFFGSTARVAGLSVRVTPKDNFLAGASVASQPFVFGNNPPP